MKNFSIVAALVVMAGCATEPECAKVEAGKAEAGTVAAKAAETKPADPFKTEYDKCMKIVRKWGMHSQPVEVLKDMPEVKKFVEAELKKPGHEKEMVELVMRTVETYDRARDFNSGVAFAEWLYANEKAHLGARLQAARYLAMKAVDEKKDYAAADAYYAKLATIKPGNPFDRPAVAKRRAYLYTLRDDKAGAIKFLEAERAKLPERDTLGRGCFDEAIADVYGAFFDYAGKLKFWQDRGNRRQAMKVLTTGEVSDRALCAKIAREIVLEDKDLGARREGWLWLWGNDTAFCRANLDKVLDKTAASTNALVSGLAGKFTTTNSHCPQLGHSPAYDLDWPCVAETWELYRRLGRAAGVPAGFAQAQYAAIAYAGLRDLKKARAAAQEGLENAKLKDEERYELSVMTALIDAGADVGRIKSAEERLAKEIPLKADLRKKMLERALGLAVLSCDDAFARAASEYYQTYIDPTPERKVYTVRFTDRNVAGAGDWANLPFKPEESPFDRKFGGPGMAFMTTDVATGDRGNAVQGGAKVREFPTTLQAVADEWGIHFVYTFYDGRARQFESGELDAGSFESYVAAGDNQPYSCFLCRLKKNARAGVMNTTYDMPGHRRLDPKDPNTVRSETVYTDDSIVHYTAFSWDAFAERVPADGNTWDFEAIFWGPVQAAWNGTKSIHGRSTWGKLRFELGDAARVKILRAQLFRAVNLYKAEKTPGGTFESSAQEGIFDHWQDDGVGDPAFYDKCLKPLVEELDAVAARVKVGMSDADVKEIAENHLSRFLNVRTEVARRRTAYLKETF